MSWRSFLEIKDVKEKFTNQFTKPEIKLDWKIKALPLTTHYALVGTAFDYLMRFLLKYHNPKAKEGWWVAENAFVSEPPDFMYDMDRLPDEITKVKETEHSFRIVEENESIPNRIEKCITFGKWAYNKYLESGIIDNQIIIASLLLGELDAIPHQYIRNSFGELDAIPPKNYPNKNLGIVDKKDVEDLRNLISIVPENGFKARSICLLNPEVGGGPNLWSVVADLLIDDSLIDIKTTMKCDFTKNMFNQLIIYYILGSIEGIGGAGGIGKGHTHKFKLNKLGIYFSRFGRNYLFKVEDITDMNELPSFIDWFKQRAQKELMIKRLKTRE